MHNLVESNLDISLNASVAITRQKIIFVGDVGVGKTSIIHAFLYQPFKDEYEASIGVDFLSKSIKFKGRTLKLQIWDSAGQEKYRSIITNYIRGSAIIFLVFDVTDHKSFENIPAWIEFVRNVDNCQMVLCGNKIDKVADRKIGKEQAQRIAAKFGLSYYEISAKADLNITKMFYSSIADLPFFDPFRKLDTNSLENEQIATLLEEENLDSRRSETANSRTELNINRKVLVTEQGNKTKERKCGC